MKIILICLLFIFCFLLKNDAYALSEYGLRCDDNPDCVECRDEVDELKGMKCQKCMHSCWNLYGPAEFSDPSKRPKGKIEQCRLEWAKWCNAQCWDPDDRTNPEYVSTKPLCNPKATFPKYNSSNPRPW
jgi:hypothetical protein